MTVENHCGLTGIEFIEFSSAKPDELDKLFKAFGFSKTMKHKDKSIDLYKQNNIVYLLNTEPASFGTDFYKAHGPCVSSMGWTAENAEKARATAVERGGERLAGHRRDHRSNPCGEFRIFGDGAFRPGGAGVG